MNIDKRTRTLTFLGVMLAITIIMDLTPLGMIPLPGVSATITHIPAIITGIILGPINGLIMGASFGFVSLFHALMRPASPLDPLFINPLLSVLPRIFIGVMSYYSFVGVRRLLEAVKVKGHTNLTISAVAGGFIGSMTNTVLVLTMMYIIYGKKILEIVITEGMFGDGTQLEDIRSWLFGIGISSGIPEAFVAAFLTTVLVVAYKNVIEKNVN